MLKCIHCTNVPEHLRDSSEGIKEAAEGSFYPCWDHPSFPGAV